MGVKRTRKKNPTYRFLAPKEQISFPRTYLYHYKFDSPVIIQKEHLLLIDQIL